MGSSLYDDEKIENLLPSMRKLAAFLKEEGFTLIEAGKTRGYGGCTVNNCNFIQGQENVFVIINTAGRPGEETK